MRYSHRPTVNSGFTLIELVIGMVVFGVAMTMLAAVIYPQVNKSVDPIFQLRATELANTLINEIQGKAFDENSTPSLGLSRCDDDVTTKPCSMVLGAEESDRDLWDDVDDYNGLNTNGERLFSGARYSDDYKNYQLLVSVVYDGDFDGIDEGNALSQRGAKLIRVAVTTPGQETLDFAIYRSNY